MSPTLRLRLFQLEGSSELVHEYPRYLNIGDLVEYALAEDRRLGFQVRAYDESDRSTTWMRVLGLLDGEAGEAVVRPEVATIRFLSSLAARKDTNVRRIGAFTVPSDSAGPPATYYPGAVRRASGMLTKGYFLEEPSGERRFVEHVSDQQRNQYVYPALRVWEQVPNLYACGWDMFTPV